MIRLLVGIIKACLIILVGLTLLRMLMPTFMGATHVTLSQMAIQGHASSLLGDFVAIFKSPDPIASLIQALGRFFLSFKANFLAVLSMIGAAF